MEQTQERKHAQRLKDTTSPSPAVPYNEPQWSGLPVEPHTLTVIKNGTVVQEVDVSTKAFHVFGRLPTCDVPLEHPSISRHHAILQFRPHSGETPPHAGAHHTLFSTNPQESGFYIYDLGIAWDFLEQDESSASVLLPYACWSDGQVWGEFKTVCLGGM